MSLNGSWPQERHFGSILRKKWKLAELLSDETGGSWEMKYLFTGGVQDTPGHTFGRVAPTGIE